MSETCAPSNFITKDSGQRDEFPSGAKRDIQVGKSRYDLIPAVALRRLADLYARGAAKYGENNFQLGIPYSRVYASLFRHLMQWRAGETDEDHACAVAWNAFALMYYEEEIKAGRLPASLNDLHTMGLNNGG